MNQGKGKLQGCQLGISDESFCIHAPSFEVAKELKDNSLQWLALQALALGVRDTKVYFSDGEKPYQIPARFAVEQVSSNFVKPVKPIATPIIKSAVDFDWNAVMQGENPTYISQMKTQANLFVSAAAIAAQSDKPPSDLLSDTAHSLNYEDELLYRCRTVVADGAINQYSYEGLRWFNEDGMWIRKRMNFVSNVWSIEYLNRPCWMEEVLYAEPVGG